MYNENYSETYDRLRKDGVIQPFKIVNIAKEISEEKFKPVEDKHVPNVQANRYLISNRGNVLDLKRDKISTGHADKDGYKIFSFITNERKGLSRKIHRVELMVFDYNPNHQQLQVNHKDGIPDNNDITNLEWCTPKENSDHAMLNDLHKMNGTDNPNSKLSEADVHEICKLIETGEYYDTEIAKIYNVSYTNISDIHKGKIWNRISRNYNLDIRKSRKNN